VLPWRYDAEIGSWTSQTRYTLRRNTANIMKGLVCFYGLQFCGEIMILTFRPK